MGSVFVVALVILLGLLVAVGVVWRYAARRYSLPCPWWLGWTLESPYMRALAGGITLLDRMGLAAGMRLLDVGCGPGRLTIPAAHRVGPGGSVVAVDIQPAMLRMVENGVAASGLTNVQTVLAGAGNGRLGPDSFDRALLVTVLGEIPEPEAALREIHDALKPGGVLSVTEVFPDPHYQSRRTVRRLAEQVGFQPGESFGSFFAFTLNYVKPAVPNQAPQPTGAVPVSQGSTSLEAAPAAELRRSADTPSAYCHHTPGAPMLRVLVRLLADAALVAILLFGSAGTLSWWRAWVLLAVLLVVRTVSAVAVWRVNPILLQERAKLPIHGDQPLTDKLLLLAVLTTGFMGLPVIAGFDVFRWHFLPRPAPLVADIGLVLFMLGWGIKALALRANAFATAVVRLHRERKHAVVDTGVYGIVRHPFYAGTPLVLVGLGLWLESYTAALGAFVPVTFLVMRLKLEDRFLRRELPGYTEYALRVPHQLLPGIW
jgi:protein-S-isoprenylcysteine O-methyltransferase Ste14/precorrin-6B methylase 2